MSIHWLHTIMQLEGVDATEKLILLAYADQANPNGVVHFPPDAKALAPFVGASRRTIERKLVNLHQRGYLEPVYEHACQLYDPPRPTAPAQAAPPHHEFNQRQFENFYDLYPRHVGKPDAEKAFRKINPDARVYEWMLNGLAEWRKSDQWTKDEGQFIPYPATWLRQKRWEDDVPSQVPRGTLGAAKTLYEELNDERQPTQAGSPDTVGLEGERKEPVPLTPENIVELISARLSGEI